MLKEQDLKLRGIRQKLSCLIRFRFLSKEDRLQLNLIRLKDRYWFQKLLLEDPALSEQIEYDTELRQYLTSWKNVKRLLYRTNERKKFKQWVIAGERIEKSRENSLLSR